MPEYGYVCPDCGMTATRVYRMGEAPGTIETDIHKEGCSAPKLIRTYTPLNIKVKYRRAEE